jgi:hypothetical protein
MGTFQLASRTPTLDRVSNQFRVIDRHHKPASLRTDGAFNTCGEQCGELFLRNHDQFKIIGVIF